MKNVFFLRLIEFALMAVGNHDEAIVDVRVRDVGLWLEEILGDNE